jgi:hypothetical protein
MISGRTGAARQLRSGLIGTIGVQALFQRSCGQPQGLSSRCQLHGFEIQIGNRLKT